MKIKQRIMITQPDLFMAGRTSSVYGLFDHKTSTDLMPKEWIDCGVIEFEIPDSIPFSAIDNAIKSIEAQEIALIKTLKELEKTKTSIIMNGGSNEPF